MAERTNPHANLIIGAQDEASPVFDKIKASSQSMAAGVEQAAAKAGKATDGMGDGAEKGAEKFTRAESLMRAAIMKSTRELELLGKTASQRFEAQIDFKGLEKAKFQEAISGLQAMESALSVAKAREAEFAAQNGFSLKAAQAKELVKASEYARWWAQELEKVEAAEKRLAGQNSFINSLKSQADAIGKTKADLLEMQAAQMGVATQAAPFIAKMREADAGIGKMGMSAKQTTAALRQVPMQFTDIVVSLQGGQSAMQVFLQQGGQLKDLFGGAGNAARALGGYVLGLVNPFTVAAAAVAGFGLAMASVNSKDAALLALSTQLAATGRASAGAVGEIKALVKELNLIPGVSKASATAIITEFAKVNGIGSDLFKSLGSSVADFAAATGTDLPTAAKKLADAFADPAKGAQALEGALGTLTAAQILSIEKMAAMGDKSGAQVAMMDALKQATEGLAKQGMTPLGEATDKMSNAWDALTSSIGNSEAFRTANSWLATLIEKVAELTVGLSQMKPPTWLQYLPVAGPAIGALRMASGTGAGSRSVSGVVGTWDEGGATGSWGPTASETEQQVKAAIAATRGYETQSAAMEKLRGVASQAKDALKELESQNRGGSVEAMRLRDSIAAMNEKLADMGKKGAPKGPTKETISEYDKLIKKLSDELPRAAAEAEAAQMGYNKSQTEFLALAGSDVWAKFTNSQRATVAVLFENKIASEQSAEAAKTLAKANLDAAASREKYITSLSTGLDKIQADIAAQIEATERMGLTKEAIADLDAAKLEMLATDLELQAIKAMDRNLDQQTYDALKKQAAAYRELGAAKKGGAAKEAALDMEKANAEAAKKAQEDWARAAEQINSSLTEALMRGFESGKDFAKNLRDTVVNMFKTMVLRPVISAIVNPVAGAVTGMMGLSGTANAATATSNGMSMLNTGISSAVQGTFSKFALSETGKSLGLSMAGPDASGYNMLSGTGQQMSQALGVVGDTLAGYAMGSMARSLISNGYSAGKGMDTFQKVGVAVGSAIGGPLVGAAIGAGAGVFNQLFGRKLKDSGIQGTFGGTEGFDGEKYEFYKGGVFRSDKTKTSPLDQATTDGLTQQFRAIQLSTGLMAETLGLASGAVASFTKDIKLSFKGLTEEQIQEKMAAEFTAISDEMAGQVLGTLQSEYAKANETASQTLTRLATSLTTVNSAFELLGVAMLDASVASGDMASRLIEQSGGGEAFAANLGTYYDNFYDQAEKTAYVTGQVTAALASVGLQMPATRDEFRAMVESQIALGDSGTQAVAALLGVSGAFASVVPAGDVLSETMKRLQSDTAGLQIELLRAQGDTPGADAAQRAIDTSGMSAAEVAIYDYNTALRAQITSLADATAAAQEQGNIRSGFERQLLELQGDTAALRALDIAGMDAYNVSLFDQVRATEAAAQAEQELAAKRAQIAQERYGLETQLLQAQGNTAALRARELELIDPSNQPLQQQIWALQDMAQAAKLASDAERELIAARVQAAQDAYRAAQSATDAAMSALERSVGAERSIYESARAAATDAAQEVKAVIDTLSGSIKDLYGEVDSTMRQSAAAGMDFVANALKNASATGYLPDAQDLGEAIAAARTGMGAENYASQFEADRDRLVLAGQLSQLSELAEPQLTAAERAVKAAEDQLETLDSILRAAQGQVDVARGIATDIKTIPGALASLQAALAAETSAKAAQAQAQVQATAKSYFELYPDVAASYALNDYGMSQQEFSATHFVKYGIDEKRIFPGFAAGINRVPQDMLAQIHKDEAVIPARFNPFNPAAQRNNDNADMLIELRALRQQNERLEARLASIEESNSTMANLLDNVTEGGNAMRSEVMA